MEKNKLKLCENVNNKKMKSRKFEDIWVPVEESEKSTKH